MDVTQCCYKVDVICYEMDDHVLGDSKSTELTVLINSESAILIIEKDLCGTRND